MHAARAVSGARLPQIYKSREREGRILYLATSAAPASRLPFLAAHLLVFAKVRFAPPPLSLHLSPAMAPPQPIVVLDPSSWPRSTVMPFALHVLVNGGQLALNVEGAPPAWIVPPVTDREPNPSYGYVVSFIRHHECGFATPASHFMRRLCYHYGGGGWSSTTSPPTRYRRRQPSLASARGSWGSQ
jgi:hypothetical protein